MKKRTQKTISKIANSTFYQLLVIYVAIIALVALGFFWKYSLNIHIFAIVLVIIGCFIAFKENGGKELKVKRSIFIILFSISFLVILLARELPVLQFSMPLGYDTGIYRYIIEHGLNNGDQWIYTSAEPGFLFIMSVFHKIFSADVILTGGLILSCIVLGFAIFFAVKTYANKSTALIALLIYAISVIQFKTYAFSYYKNIIGMSLILFSIILIKKSEEKPAYSWLLVLCAGVLGTIHRPSFFIFGISYFFYAFISPWKENKYDKKTLIKNILIGTAILIFFITPYLGKFQAEITGLIHPVASSFAQPGESPGTFINFFTYQFSILPYLPFAIIGLGYFIRKKEFNMLVIWAAINLIFVYFQFFFFNRLIIFLDLALIILSAVGISVLLSKRSKIAIILTVVLLFSAFVLMAKEVQQTTPLISQQDLTAIKQFGKTESNAFAMTTSSIYSPWLQGYSERKVIAPGLFDYNKDNYAQWQEFWKASTKEEITSFLNDYQKPLYIFVGEKQKDQFANITGCFDIFYQDGNSKIYKYGC